MGKGWAVHNGGIMQKSRDPRGQLSLWVILRMNPRASGINRDV